MARPGTPSAPPGATDSSPPCTGAHARAATAAALRARRDAMAREVRRCERAVARLRAELALPPEVPGEEPPAERAMIRAVRDLVQARARLAQHVRETRHAGQG